MIRFQICRAFFLMVAMIAGFSVFANPIVAKLDQVCVTSEGLFVHLNGQPLAVESITMANDGFIVAVPIPLPMAACPICGSSKYVPGRMCPVCGFPDND